MTRNPLDKDYLGGVFEIPPQEVLIVDPFACMDHDNLEILLKFFTGIASMQPKVQVLAKKLWEKNNQSRDFQSVKEQERAVRDTLLKSKLQQLQVTLRDGRWMQQHDRRILVKRKDGVCFRILLGQGLFSFHAECRKESEGVYFETPAEDFRESWQSFVKHDRDDLDIRG